MKIDLSKYNNEHYVPGNRVVCIMWFIINALLIQNKLNAFNGFKLFVLRLFGAKIGVGVVIKPGVNIKYPWRLEVGDYVWIGENVWIDNLDNIFIGNNVCISQDVMLLCGNHNYKKNTFNLVIGKINIEDGVWIGARSIISQNVVCKSHSVLMINSVATSNLNRYSIYRGNPAVKVRDRI